MFPIRFDDIQNNHYRLFSHYGGEPLAGQYSHKQFFRHIPNAQLENYFRSQNIELAINCSDFKEKEVERIFLAFTALPEDQQASIEAEFQDIHAMACEGGINALIAEAYFYQDENFVEAISEIEGFHAKVMWAFLEKQRYWQGANCPCHPFQ